MDTKIIRLPQVKEMVGLGTTKVYEMIKNDEFPKQVKLGRASGWIESEIKAWIDERARQRGGRCMSKDTGTEYLRQHKINGLLKKLGVTDEQKGAAHLVTLAEVRFLSWPVTSKVNWPSNTATAKRAWCALKWLMLDNPADSGDTDDAWKCVSEFTSTQELEAGTKHLRNAKKAGAKASTESFSEAEKFAEIVAKLMKKNSKLKLTPAIEAAAKIHGVGKSTGWKYMKKIKDNTKK